MKIKICGLTREEDVDAVNAALPDYAGFVFAPSRRRVTPERAAALRARLSPRVIPVGVFVNEQAETVAALVRSGVIDAAQLHGDEDEAYIAAVKRAAPCPVIKAVRVGNALPQLPKGADYLLFDAYSPTAYGGTGRAFDWRLLEGVDLPYFLAGGIRAENLAEAMATKAYALDVSGGVEENGQKSGKLIGDIVRAVREQGHE